MFVCLCFGVTDGDVQELLDNGCSTLRGIQRACNAGKSCGACIRQIKKMTDERRDSRSETSAECEACALHPLSSAG